ncbi:MAG: nitroreductase family protein [Clostridia bacterium]
MQNAADTAIPTNTTLTELSGRKSVRAYEKQEISSAEKQAILYAAVSAPTAGNQQLYTILDISNQAIKNRLADTCDHQPFIAKASMVLIFVADCQKWYDAFAYGGCLPRKPGAGDLFLAVTDAAIAAQNAVVAAQSLGIGSCYIGDIMESCEEHRALLQLPEYAVPVVMLVLGYPTQQQQTRPKPERCDMRYIVHENGYQRMDASALQDMLRYKAGERPYEEWLAAFCARKYQSAFSREMTRSMEKYLAAFREE